MKRLVISDKAQRARNYRALKEKARPGGGATQAGSDLQSFKLNVGHTQKKDKPLETWKTTAEIS
ncbi:hypothetical protein [Runella salmonicolor]|uniref:Uncharacterized protein n=1 Tax=Runella salmonicolor TaxID=2950278 RepID=A0ABT1FQY5_9BACT|nr:hypothetical protein [Runella salmonicolor]MCP1384162.1 hypothetical protein [Runella salmonicolor]